MSHAADLRSVARLPDFRRLYVTRVTSQLSDGVFQVALASYVFFSPERQTSAPAVAAAFATLLLPYSLVGPFAGVLLDRWRRRQVLVVANVVRAGVVLALAPLVTTGATGLPFYLTALVALSINRFYLAALSAALPHVVPTPTLVVANSLSTTSGTLAAFAGAGLGYLGRALVGPTDAGTASLLALAAALYLAAAGLALRLRPPLLLGPDPDPDRPPTVAALRGVLAGLVDGARHVRRRPAAGIALAAITAHRFYYGISTVAALLLFRNYFSPPGQPEAGLAGLAVAFVASAAGYLLAAVLTPLATARMPTSSWVAGLFAGAAVVQVAFGAPYTRPLFYVAAFLLGVVAQGAKICVDTIVQETVSDAYRGRVFSLYDVLFNVSFVGAAAFAAVTLPPSGRSYPVLAVVAAGYALTAAAYDRASRRHPVPEPLR
ncbi:MAG: MFS transporter [Actinomycetota bacterium]